MEISKTAAVLEIGEPGPGAGRPGDVDRLPIVDRRTAAAEPVVSDDDIQYFAPGPEFKLSQEAAAQKAYPPRRRCSSSEE